MRYKVPRHVDYKAKIVGPATFSQLLYIAVAGFIILFLYFVAGESVIFIPLAIILGGGGVALAFVQVAGQPLPEYIKKMVLFSISSREYVWEKKMVPMDAAIPKRKAPQEEKSEKDNQRQSKRRGSLGDMASKIETF